MSTRDVEANPSRPCGGGFATGSLIIGLREDVEYSEDELVKQLMEKGMSRSEAANVWEELFQFVDKELSRFIRALLVSVYENLEVESDPPFANPWRNTIFMGEWIGAYRFSSRTLGREVEIRVIPKIETRHFVQMLNDVSGLVSMLGYPAMKVVWLNIHGLSHARDHVSYSGMLRQLTELLMAEGLPPTTSPKELICSDTVGHVNRSKTIRLLTQGVPLVVARVQEIGYPKIPLLILTKFHAIIQKALLQLLSDLEAVESPVLKPLKDMILDMVRYHSYVLTTDVLGMLVDTAWLADLESSEVLEKAREQAGKSKSLRDLIDLYQSYVRKRPPAFELFNKWRQSVPVQPLPSGKVYELWLLTLLVKIFVERLSATPLIKEGDGGFEFDFEEAEIGYNLARGDWSKVFSGVVRPPRPDFILIGKGRRVVADAKYREPRRLSVEDVERIIAYVVNYSEPQDREEIKGFLITLGESDLGPVIARTDTTPNIKIYHLTADPRRRDVALSRLKAVYEKVFA
jgi:uncharacterized protein YihD (DUF1040 family)